jgi:hypothetical protein
MVEWFIGLDGPEESLKRVANLNLGEVYIVCKESKYHLHSSKLDLIDKPELIRIEAKKLINSINVCMILDQPYFEPIKWNGTLTSNIDGKLHHYVTIAHTEFRLITYAPVNRINSQIIGEDPTKISKRIEIGQKLPNVERVLRILNTQPWDFKNLYNVLDIIEQDCKDREISIDLFINKTLIDTFTGTANNYKASGDEARHQKDFGEKPSKTMTIQEAKNLFSELVKRWLDSFI